MQEEDRSQKTEVIRKEMLDKFAELKTKYKNTAFTEVSLLHKACATVINGYLKDLAKVSGRSVIVYYQNLHEDAISVKGAINRCDVPYLQQAMALAPNPLGVDLFIQTKGGVVDVADQFIRNLKLHYHNNIRIFVLGDAMSSGTLIACSAQTLCLGRKAHLGPVDAGIRPSAQIIADLGLNAEKWKDKNLQTQDIINYYQDEANVVDKDIAQALKTHPQQGIQYLIKAVTANQKVVDILNTALACMFHKQADLPARINQVQNNINNHLKYPDHNYRIDLTECQKIGLNIFDLRENTGLYTLARSINRAVKMAMELPKEFDLPYLQRIIQTDKQPDSFFSY